jgi:hypothetical protein
LRAVRWNPFIAFVLTFTEALLALTTLRFIFRAVKWVGRRGKPLVGSNADVV